ncbi:MAG: hypothetical protein ACRERC_04800 [Candidatus Binatia bacterium]
MMRCDSFSRSGGFAALAAAGWLPWAAFSAPWMGVSEARALYLLAVAVLYIAALAAGSVGRRHLSRPGVVLLAALGAAGVGLAAGETTDLVLGLAVLIGVARSVFLYQAAPARAALLEVALLGGGLLFARLLAAGSPAPTAVGIWSFLLVQSCFFLVAGRAPRPAPAAADAFEEAHRRALTLLE